MKKLAAFFCVTLILCFCLVSSADTNIRRSKTKKKADIVKVKTNSKSHSVNIPEQPVVSRRGSDLETAGRNTGVARTAVNSTLDTEQPGDNCGNPLIIGSLPFYAVNQYTCGRGHSIDLECVGWSDPSENEDIVYEWTVTEADFYYIYFNTDNTVRIQLVLLDSCPSDSIAANCLYTYAAMTSDGNLMSCEFLDVGTYYLVITTFNNSAPYCLDDFNLEIASCTENCATDYAMTAPFTDSGYLAGMGDDCQVTFYDYDDVIYAVTIPHDGIWEFTTCGSLSPVILCIGTMCCSHDIAYQTDAFCDVHEPNYAHSYGQYRGEFVAGTYYATLEYTDHGLADFTFSVTELPPPTPLADNCADAIEITELPFTSDGYIDINSHTVDLSCCNEEGIYCEGPDKYFMFTPPGNMTISVTTCGSLHNTLLEIFEGCPTAGGFSIGCSDDDGCEWYRESCISGVNLAGGTTYYFVLGSYKYMSGYYRLLVEEGDSGCMDTGSCPNSIPGGETAADAPVIPSLPFKTCYNSCDYADDYDGGCSYGSGGLDAAYAYTPTTSMCVDINTCGSRFDSQLYVLDSDEHVIACNDDDSYDVCDDRSNAVLLNIFLAANETYYIIVDGYSEGDCGVYYLSIDGEDATPAVNAECTNAELLSLPAVITGNSTNGGQPLGSDCDENTAPGLWYKVVGDGNLITASTCSENTDYDTYISVYENGCETLTCVGYNDDSYCESSYENVSRFSWCGESGTEYLIFVHGYSGEFGHFELTVTSESDIACGGECDCQTLENSFCGTDLPAAIPDGTGDSLWVTINEPFQHIVERMSVCFDITHPAVEELKIILYPPVGYVAGLVVPGDASGANFTCTTIDDHGPYMFDGTAPYSGSFHGYNDLGDFIGEEAQGNWRLLFLDDQAGNSGILNYTCIHFETDEILPVELTSFDAVPGDRQITLNWSTASENDNDHFDIIRNNTTIGRIPASNLVSGDSYTWTETNLINGREYTYTLNSVDVYGNIENIGSVSSVPSFNSATISEYALYQNYPNPFNPSTSIVFDLVESGFMKLAVYNTLGQTVATLVNSEMTAGRHTISFDAETLPSGLYFYRMDSGDFSAVKKMILMK